jgi:cytochrome c556
MKKALVISMLAGSFLFGQQEVIYPDRMKNMQEMETAMSEIQKGFLYDNVNVVKNGVKHLKVTIAHTESFIKEGVGENKINNKVYAKKVADQIGVMADEILTTFEKGDRYSAANNYLLILSKCLSCHQTVRSW